jgi:lipopolysaccharide export system permease protein
MMAWPPLRLLDRYLLAQFIAPTAAAMAVLLTTLLLYRVLDISRALAARNISPGPIPSLLGDVLPQYVGLTLPIGFFIGVFLAAGRLDDGSELEALQAGGVALERIAAPFFAGSLVIAAIEGVALGFGEPYGRYHFNMDLVAAAEAVGTGDVQPGVPTLLGDDIVLNADQVDPDGHSLHGVVIIRRTSTGMEQVTTARRGRLSGRRRPHEIALALSAGQTLEFEPDGETRVGSFDQFSVVQRLPTTPDVGTRGATNDRELTLPELSLKMARGADASARRKAAAEFHARVARIASTPLFPILAIPMAMSAKRRKRASAAIACGLILYLYENGLDFGQRLGESGHLPPAVTVWVPFTVFAALSLWLFFCGRLRPGSISIPIASR